MINMNDEEENQDLFKISLIAGGIGKPEPYIGNLFTSEKYDVVGIIKKKGSRKRHRVPVLIFDDDDNCVGTKP
jgi:hypothetical protein